MSLLAADACDFYIKEVPHVQLGFGLSSVSHLVFICHALFDPYLFYMVIKFCVYTRRSNVYLAPSMELICYSLGSSCVVRHSQCFCKCHTWTWKVSSIQA